MADFMENLRKKITNKGVIMKDIKSFFIGFLSCLCLMLFMGQTNQPNDNIGRYQGFADDYKTYLIDTRNGQTYFLKGSNLDNISWKKYPIAKIGD